MKSISQEHVRGRRSLSQHGAMAWANLDSAKISLFELGDPLNGFKTHLKTVYSFETDLYMQTLRR